MMVANMSVLENSSFLATDLIYGEIFEKNFKNNIFFRFQSGALGKCMLLDQWLEEQETFCSGNKYLI